MTNVGIANRVRRGVTGALGVDRENGSSERIAGFCAERKMFVTKTFHHTGMHKYT